MVFANALLYRIEQGKCGVFEKHSGKKGEAMPVVRNTQFYFKEGFCWSHISSEFIKCRFNNTSVFDITSMSLFSQCNLISDKFLVCMVYSYMIDRYIKTFINSTVHFQINDAKQIPIINDRKLKEFEKLFDEAYTIKLDKFEKLSKLYSQKELQRRTQQNLDAVQERLDKAVYTLYGL